MASDSQLNNIIDRALAEPLQNLTISTGDLEIDTGVPIINDDGSLNLDAICFSVASDTVGLTAPTDQFDAAKTNCVENVEASMAGFGAQAKAFTPK